MCATLFMPLMWGRMRERVRSEEMGSESVDKEMVRSGTV